MNAPVKYPRRVAKPKAAKPTRAQRFESAEALRAALEAWALTQAKARMRAARMKWSEWHLAEVKDLVSDGPAHDAKPEAVRRLRALRRAVDDVRAFAREHPFPTDLHVGAVHRLVAKHLATADGLHAWPELSEVWLTHAEQWLRKSRDFEPRRRLLLTFSDQRSAPEGYWFGRSRRRREPSPGDLVILSILARVPTLEEHEQLILDGRSGRERFPTVADAVRKEDKRFRALMHEQKPPNA
jgi:hypothetical protein